MGEGGRFYETERAQKIAQELRALPQHPILEKYRPEFLTEGGDQFVFTLQGAPDVVAKIRRDWLRALVRNVDVHNKTFQDWPDDIRSIVEKRMQEEHEIYKQLCRYFPGMVPYEGMVTTPIPFTFPLVDALFSDYVDEIAQTTSIETPVRIQERIQFNKEQSVSIPRRHIDRKHPITPVQFSASVRMLHKKNIPQKNTWDFFPDLREELLDRFPIEASLRAVMKEFVLCAARYTRETDNVLDLAGSYNVLLTRDKASHPKIILLDAASPVSERTFTGAREAIQRVGKLGMHARDRNDIKNVIHYARLMTTLAHAYAPEVVATFAIPELASTRTRTDVHRLLATPAGGQRVGA